MAVITRKLSELFEEFLRTWQDKGGAHKYRERIAQLAATGDKSVVVDYEDIIQFNTDLGERLLSQPDESLKEFRMAAFEVLSTENASYAGQMQERAHGQDKGDHRQDPPPQGRHLAPRQDDRGRGDGRPQLRAEAPADRRGLHLSQRARDPGAPGRRHDQDGRSSARAARRPGTSSSTRRGARSSTARS